MIKSTAIEFQRQKVEHFLRALKQHLSQNQDQEQIDAYIARFMKQLNDAYFSSLF